VFGWRKKWENLIKNKNFTISPVEF
jgi:hypothetical protein